jgi:hypothetical protein
MADVVEVVLDVSGLGVKDDRLVRAEIVRGDAIPPSVACAQARGRAARLLYMDTLVYP